MRWPSALLAALITLHQPSGVIYVNPDEIMVIQPGLSFNCSAQFKSAVTVHDRTLCVLETPAEVKRLRDGG